MSADQYRFIEANGLRFNIIDTGSGKPVVFLHGFPDSSALWRSQVPALSDAGLRCIAPDLRGFGDSDKPEGVAEYALPAILSDVTGIMGELGVSRAAMVGHDWGAVVGWLLASFMPERVDRLVSISVGHPAGIVRRSLEQLQKSWYILLFQFAGLAEEAWRRDDWQLFRTWLDGGGDPDRYIEDLSRPGALTSGLNWYRANASPESFLVDPPAFPPIEVPVLGIWGTRDPYLSESLMTDSARFVTGPWRYERFDGAHHWIPLEDSDRLNPLLVEFLAGSG